VLSPTKFLFDLEYLDKMNKKKKQINDMEV